MELQEALASVPFLAKYAADCIRTVRLGGLTNTNYLVTIDDDSIVDRYVLRLPGGGTDELMDRKKEHHNATLASKLGVNSEMLFFNQDSGLQLTKYLQAATLSPVSMRQPDVLNRSIRALKEIHDCKAQFSGTFSLAEELAKYEGLTKRSDLVSGFDKEWNYVQSCLKELEQLPLRESPAHCDTIPDNFLDDGSKVYLIDWEYSAMNDPNWDLGSLACECDFDDRLDAKLLATYYERKPSMDEYAAFLHFKILSDFLWYLWAVFKSQSASSNIDYRKYGNDRYQRYLSRRNRLKTI